MDVIQQSKGKIRNHPAKRYGFIWQLIDKNGTRPGQRLHNELERSTMLSMGKSM